MKKLIFAALLLSAIGASAQQDTLKYRINLTDKAVTDYALDRPEEFLSKKAIAVSYTHLTLPTNSLV